MSIEKDWTICAGRHCGWQGTSKDYVWKPELVEARGIKTNRGHCPKCDGVAFYIEKPLFIPLKAEFFEEFERGEKDTEYRRRTQQWNGTACRIGRRVVLSRGYGKARRLTGTIVGFHYDNLPTVNIPRWLEVYPDYDGGGAVCIKIKLDPK